jgi:hypothetical protein
MRRTIPEIKAKDIMLTSETSMTPIKGVNVTNKVGVAHIMEESVLQTAVATWSTTRCRPRSGAA